MGTVSRLTTHRWELHDGMGRVVTIPHTPRFVTDDMTALREAALAGLDMVQLPTLYVFEDCRAGRLVQAIPAWRPRSGIVHAVFPSRRGLLPAVRELLEFLAQECATRRNAMAGF